MIRRAIVAIGLAFGLASAALGQSFPSRPMTMIVPFAAGGPLDVLGRTLAEPIKAALGQPVVIENVTGAAGSIGFARVARAAPDGHTFGLGMWSTHVVNGVIYPLSYDVVTDFAPISLLVNNVDLVVTRNGAPWSDAASLVAWLKANPDRATWGTQGVGGPSHVGGLLFQEMTGTRVRFVHYRGLAPAMQDVVAGHIDLALPPPDIALPLIRAGQIKGLAVTDPKRLSIAPEIPTVDEAGLKGFYFSVWTAMWAPKGTPKEIVAKLNAAIVGALAVPEIRSRLASLGQDVFPPERQTPEALAAFHKAEIERWWPLLKAANIKPE